MQTTQNAAKPNYPGLVASHDSRPGHEVGLGLFYNARLRAYKAPRVLNNGYLTRVLDS